MTSACSSTVSTPCTVRNGDRAVKYDQRVQAERAWLAEALKWARIHPDATVADVIAAIPNPHDLLVRPLAGAALAVADREAW